MATVVQQRDGQTAIVVTDARPAVVVDNATQRVIQAGQQGPAVAVDNAAQRVIQTGQQGPAGPPGPPSTFDGTSDDVPEGTEHLYYTDARAAAAAPVQSVNGQTGDVVLDADDVQADPVGTALAAAASAITIHRLDTDPHPGAVIDGGNF